MCAKNSVFNLKLSLHVMCKIVHRYACVSLSLNGHCHIVLGLNCWVNTRHMRGLKSIQGLNFCPWRCRFRTSAHEIAMAIPRAEVRNSEFQMLNPVFWPFLAIWHLEFRIPNFCPWNPHGNSMSRSSESASPWTDVQALN